MKYHLTPDIWLQVREDRTLVSNVRTGRRALLSPQELEQLELFTSDEPSHEESESLQRFLDADLVQGEARPECPRLEPLLNALDRHLLREQGYRKSRIEELFPEGPAKLHQVRTYLSENVVNDSYLPHVLQRDLNALLDHVATFLQEEQSEPHPDFRFRRGFVSLTGGRPLPRGDYEQQPCMPITTQRRVELARERVDPQSRALILGDDDLLSLYWSLRMKQECDVFELDQELIDFLTPRLAPHLSLKTRDLTLGLPREFHGLYDLVFTDPMYEESGMDLFMRCCGDALSDSPEARVLFTTRPDMIDAGDRFEERLSEAGLGIEQRVEDFSRYRLPNFYRRKLIQGFGAHGISPQLVQGLTKIPYLYADLFILKKM